MSAVHWHDFDHTHARDTVLRWAAGGMLVVGVTALAVYAALTWHKVEAGEASPPAAVMIELAPLAVSQPSEAEVAPGPQMVQAPESTPDAPDRPETEAPPPEPVVQQQVEPVPEVAPTPEKAEVVLPKPEPKPEPVKDPPKQKVERPKKEAKPTKRTAAPTTSAAPRSDAPPETRTAAPSEGAAAARSAALADWRSRALSHLNRFKRPQDRGATGRATVAVALSASGTVTSARLAGSSGNDTLDREAVSLVQRASPLPAPPEGRSISFSVPIVFTGR